MPFDSLLVGVLGELRLWSGSVGELQERETHRDFRIAAERLDLCEHLLAVRILWDQLTPFRQPFTPVVPASELRWS